MVAYKARLERLHAAALLRMMDLVGLDTPGASITVVLVPEHHDFARATPRFIAGFARSEAGSVVLFPSRTVAYPHDSPQRRLQPLMGPGFNRPSTVMTPFFLNTAPFFITNCTLRSASMSSRGFPETAIKSA
jgi:hypothetical protein